LVLCQIANDPACAAPDGIRTITGPTLNACGPRFCGKDELHLPTLGQFASLRIPDGQGCPAGIPSIKQAYVGHITQAISATRQNAHKSRKRRLAAT
jgi:hypothetical protein